MNPAVAEVTKTVFFYNPPDAVTVTVTQTPTVPVQTVTLGRPWTTATGSYYTRTLHYPTPSVAVFHQYPPQPQLYQQFSCHHDKRAGAIAAAFFGGMAAGIVFLVIGMVIWRQRRRVREAREGQIQLKSEGSVDFEYDILGRGGNKTPDVEGVDTSNSNKQTGNEVSGIFYQVTLLD
jgi:hypothetical protein